MNTIKLQLASILFIGSIILGLMLPSCNSSTSPDIREGQRIGTWMVYDTEADWVGTGSSSKNKSLNTTIQAENDTIDFTSPDSIAVRMTTSNESDVIGLSFYDSTSHYENNGGHVMTNNPFYETRSWAMENHDDYTRVILNINYPDCDSSYTESEDLLFIYSDIPYYEENGPASVNKIIRIKADGIVSSAKKISGCDYEP